MTNRERSKTGEYVETVTPDRVLDAVATHPDPTVSAREVGDALGCSTDAARQKLNNLHEQGRIERKKVGGRSVVWWLTDEERSRGGSVDPLYELVGMLGDEKADRLREHSREFREEFDERIEQTRRELDDENGESEEH